MKTAIAWAVVGLVAVAVLAHDPAATAVMVMGASALLAIAGVVSWAVCELLERYVDDE